MIIVCCRCIDLIFSGKEKVTECNEVSRISQVGAGGANPLCNIISTRKTKLWASVCSGEGGVGNIKWIMG